MPFVNLATLLVSLTYLLLTLCGLPSQVRAQSGQRPELAKRRPGGATRGLSPHPGNDDTSAIAFKPRENMHQSLIAYVEDMGTYHVAWLKGRRVPHTAKNDKRAELDPTPTPAGVPHTKQPVIPVTEPRVSRDPRVSRTKDMRKRSGVRTSARGLSSRAGRRATKKRSAAKGRRSWTRKSPVKWPTAASERPSQQSSMSNASWSRKSSLLRSSTASTTSAKPSLGAPWAKTSR